MENSFTNEMLLLRIHMPHFSIININGGKISIWNGLSVSLLLAITEITVNDVLGTESETNSYLINRLFQQ